MKSGARRSVVVLAGLLAGLWLTVALAGDQTFRANVNLVTVTASFKIRSYVFGKDFGSDATKKGDRPALTTELYVTGRSRDLDTYLAQVANDFRNQYTLAYYSDAPPDGRFHTIRVTTTPGFAVEARTGYFGRE